MKQLLNRTFSIGFWLTLAVIWTGAAFKSEGAFSFTWVPDSQNVLASSGTLTYDPVSGLVTSINWHWSWYDGTAYTDNTPAGFGGSNPLRGTLLGNSDLFLEGFSSGNGGSNPWNGFGPGVAGGPDENFVATGGGDGATYNGNWVQAPSPVPEPATWIAGAMLALPFGVSGLRKLRNRKNA